MTTYTPPSALRLRANLLTGDRSLVHGYETEITPPPGTDSLTPLMTITSPDPAFLVMTDPPPVSVNSCNEPMSVTDGFWYVCMFASTPPLCDPRNLRTATPV